MTTKFSCVNHRVNNVCWQHELLYAWKVLADGLHSFNVKATFCESRSLKFKIFDVFKSKIYASFVIRSCFNTFQTLTLLKACVCLWKVKESLCDYLSLKFCVCEWMDILRRSADRWDLNNRLPKTSDGIMKSCPSIWQGDNSGGTVIQIGNT